MPLLPGWVEQILASERNPVRFESFCLALLYAEGKRLLPTSRTYDLGRDGRRIADDNSGRRDVLCVSLERSVASKAGKDAKRLLGTTKVRELYFCSNVDLTEHAASEVESSIRDELPDLIDIEVIGLTQLIDLSLRQESIFESNYGAEVDSLKRALAPRVDGGPEELEEKALRLALITQTGDDALALRQDLAKRLVLELLAESGKKTVNDIAAVVAQQLRLPHALSSAYITSVLRDLKEQDFVSVDRDIAEATKAGIDFVTTIPEVASANLLEGREVIHAAILKLSGHNLQSDEFNRFWKRFQDALASTFYLHASTIIAMVAALERADVDGNPEEARELRMRLAEYATTEMTSASRKDEVRQAIVDMFSEKDSDAFRWLSSVCSVFVMLCSLGLEAKSAEQTAKSLRNITLLTDTDILLSLLCEGEPNHEETRQIVAAWQALRGRVAAPTPALEEAAYHAWIATREYESSADLLPRIDDNQASHLINNAFVRTFHHLATGRLARRFWDNYMRAFRGKGQYDYSTIVDYLRAQYKLDLFVILPDNVQREAGSLYNRMQSFMIRERGREANCGSDELDSRVVDKCRRDALLLALIHEGRRRAVNGEPIGMPIAVSSAALLKRTDRAFRAELGEPEAVISLPAVAVLLTLVPGVSMTLGTLRGVLFDLRLAKRLHPLQQYVYRLLATSDEYDLPWSKRGTLQRELGGKLLEDAKTGGRRIRDLEDKIMSSSEPERSAEAVKEVLDRMAIDPASATLVRDQQKEIARLREIVERLSRSPKAQQ